MQFKVRHLLIVVFVFIAEILVATTFAHISFIRSFISDFLVVMLIYHLIKVVVKVTPWRLAVAVFVFSCGVEISQYFHLTDALGLRRGSLVSVLLGNSFSWGDIVMYALGCATSYAIDSRFLSKSKPPLWPPATCAD